MLSVLMMVLYYCLGEPSREMFENRDDAPLILSASLPLYAPCTHRTRAQLCLATFDGRMCTSEPLSDRTARSLFS